MVAGPETLWVGVGEMAQHTPPPRGQCCPRDCPGHPPHCGSASWPPFLPAGPDPAPSAPSWLLPRSDRFRGSPCVPRARSGTSCSTLTGGVWPRDPRDGPRAGTGRIHRPGAAPHLTPGRQPGMGVPGDSQISPEDEPSWSQLLTGPTRGGCVAPVPIAGVYRVGGGGGGAQGGLSPTPHAFPGRARGWWGSRCWAQ